MGNKGFTLVELLVVILVLAVLTGISIPAYGLITARARESATESEMMNIARALELHNSDSQHYPLPEDYPEALQDNDYMDRVPAGDAWDCPYSYDSDGSTYTITSSGKDGILGNGDDITVSDGTLISEGAYSN